VKVFLDTNVLASALTARGLCADVLQTVLADHQLLISAEVLAELADVLPRKFGLPSTVVDEFLALLSDEGILSAAPGPCPILPDNPADAVIVASALAGGAEVFVTGDKELSDLGKAEGMPVLSPRQFWERLSSET
jgi:putative PIN family toxin of toxin-antitoxin system